MSRAALRAVVRFRELLLGWKSGMNRWHDSLLSIKVNAGSRSGVLFGWLHYSISEK
ncbi:MAG: hypothetical protein Q3X14_01895 [Eggerthellaceae bacterium]|nr:hypothetical protein [Eggerthellaceae bacterium]